VTDPRYGHPGYGSSPEEPDYESTGPVDPYGRPSYQDPSYGQPPPPPPGYRDPRYERQPGYQPAAPRRSEPPRRGEPGGWNGSPGWNDPPGWSEPPGRGEFQGRGEPPRPAPPRRARRVWIAIRLVVAIVLLAVVAYLLIAHSTSHKPTDSAAGGPSPSQGSGSPAPAVSHPGDLRKYLMAAPAKSHHWPKPLGTHEKLSLRQAIRLANSNRAIFTEFRFRSGAVRCWITVNSTWIDMRLYRFRSADDAQGFFRFDTRRSARVTPAAGQSPIKTVPGARVFAELKADSDGILSVLAIGVKGDVVFVADVAEQARTPHLGVLNKLMREQYGKL
jgi:hypothetical protein